LRRLASSESGFTLVELLIAMVVMAIGISAIVAGYSSGLLGVNRARLTSTAGTLADKQMEAYRQGSFSSVPTTLQTATTPAGPDGHTYWMQVGGVWSCAVGTYSAGPPASCSGSTPASNPVKRVTITVRDGSATAKVLFTEDATFDASTG
jgi:prepilin-type N-terminal cleavage/methylation domain-containing protein